MNIAVLGGLKYENIFKKIFQKKVKIAFFLDNNPQVCGTTVGGKKIYSPYNFPQGVVKYIIIFVRFYDVVIREMVDLGVDPGLIINFNDPQLDFNMYPSVFIPDGASALRMQLRVEYLEKKVQNLENEQRYLGQNFIYEVADRFQKGEIKLPKICSVEKTCEKIIKDKCSVSRYGDGEFQIILGQAKDVYQSDNAELGERLKRILVSDLQNHIVALADDYGAMDGLREENKTVIRKYMTLQKREEHYRLLNMDKQYYNAYISRPYVIYPHDDLKSAKKRFDDLKRIWNNERIILVEGDKTRMGVGNDLFDNAMHIERIIAPNENAFSVYDEILGLCFKQSREKLFLIALGPTATVLAYDLAQAGYWAIDIGHLDLEYEWFLKGKGYSYIPSKYNNEMPGDTQVTELQDETYEKTIIGSVGV